MLNEMLIAFVTFCSVGGTLILFSKYFRKEIENEEKI